MAGPNETRRADIRRALRRVKPEDEWQLEDFAVVWGVVKSRFITLRNSMVDFPVPRRSGTGNSYLYPAKAGLEAMLAHETRHDAARKERQSRQQRLLEGKRKRSPANESMALPVDELLKINRLAQEIEARESAQRETVDAADVRRTAGLIFAKVTTFVANFVSIVDPNGELTADFRSRLDERGREALLSLHADIEGLLTGERVGNETSRSRKPNGRARRPRTPRQRG